MAKVLVGVTLAVMLGAGPAVAWDMTTQMPRQSTRAASAIHGTSPWKRAGRDLKDAFKAVARVYLPRTHHAVPAQQARLAPAPTASSIASAVPLVPSAPPPLVLEIE
ncbi:MAG TPA: hypothetical protein VMI75_29485 [Polyangiaceae bacterium]|nr:hypothetical protein [Polyangiaceae bacterium]